MTRLRPDGIGQVDGFVAQAVVGKEGSKEPRYKQPRHGLQSGRVVEVLTIRGRGPNCDVCACDAVERIASHHREPLVAVDSVDVGLAVQCVECLLADRIGLV